MIPFNHAAYHVVAFALRRCLSLEISNFKFEIAFALTSVARPAS